MKSTLHFTLASLFIGSVCIAQPTITLQDVTPAIGSTVLTVNGPHIEPGPGGADQTWDFSGMTAQSTNERTCLAPEGLPESESFPDATHVWFFQSSGQQYTYTAYSGNTIDEIGFYSLGQNATIHTTYTDPLSQPVFPLNYGDTFSDSFENQTLNEVDLGQTNLLFVNEEVGTYEAVVDGYGTLITPMGTYEDVLRIYIETEIDWTVSSDGVETGSGARTRSEYLFYKAGYATPLVTMGITTLYSDGEEVNVTPYGIYFASSTVGIDEISSPFSGIELFPVPTQNHFNLKIQSEETIVANVSMFSVDGKLVSEWPGLYLQTGNNEQLFHLPELPEGLYILRIATGNSSESRRLVIGR